MAWTKTTRKQYRRVGLRYASDTTVKEWLLSIDFCRNGVTLAARLPGPFASSWMAFSICLRPAANGVLCRKTFRRSPRSSITFTIGVIATCGGA